MHILASFPLVRIGLMVGISAGIPKLKRDRKTNKYHDPRDIRLGDVIFGQPAGIHGGVNSCILNQTIGLTVFRRPQKALCRCLPRPLEFQGQC
ncbi:hypothetical protein BB8028_0003g15260 [Beauveria bassiana]|uniref:Uncharacterized protein n=1 Tax=Beauveria bassiana TaxID=176275 RepID=A0A2S7Y9R1_BEABA|nr:hypothetical protein BB8028_0003g15260 [Beauveria bassiana]